MRFTLEPASDGVHKYVATFTPETGRSKSIPFGAKGMSDYTLHHDKMRRARYLARHRATETWTDPQTAGALSRWILWGPSTSLRENVRAFKRRFSLS